MLWFEGSIPAAVISAKEKGSVFVAVIAGDDEQSTQMISSWEDDRVVEATGHTFVAIKIDAKSETCVQFSQIYPVVCIPSSFFIGESGIPLEVIAGYVPAEELMKRIAKVKQMQTEEIGVSDSVLAQAGEDTDTSPPSSVTSEAVAQQASTSAKGQPDPTPSPSTAPENKAAPAASAASKESLSMPAEEGASSGYVTPAEDRSVSSDDMSLSSQPDKGQDAKVERLTKKLDERQERKKKGEEENEIKKEIDRRRMGKEMLDYKKKQEGDSTKRMLEERNRDKAEEKAARDRVRQQIALDRADRAARYARNKEEVDAAKAAALQAQQVVLEARKEALQRERSTVARIQFRLPDGSFFTNQFPSETRLQEARQFAAQEVGNRYGNFSLATMFPRREFSDEDLDRTLLELQLAPSASIVLLPQAGRPASVLVQSTGGGIWALLGTIFYPLLALWRLINGFLFCSPPPSPSTPERPDSAPISASAFTSASSGETTRESIRKRLLEKDGKVYRLRTEDDSEDENNTWNGNSTQQISCKLSKENQNNTVIMASTKDVSSENESSPSSLLSPAEQAQLSEAMEELAVWRSKVDKAETEKSRLILEKLETEETRKRAQKEVVNLSEQQQKSAEASLKRKKGLEDSILQLEKDNQALVDRLKEYEDMLKNKRSEYSSLQQIFKIKADIPEAKVKFTGVETEREEENDRDIVSVFTITQKPLFHLKGGQALITFEEQKVAENILKLRKCDVVFANSKMDVKPSRVTLQPSVKFEIHISVSKRKIRYSDVPPCLPEERMRDRLEIGFSKPSQGGGEVEEVVYNTDTGTGEITFLNTGVAELLALKKRYTVDIGRKVDVGVRPYFEYKLKTFQTYCGVSSRTVLLGGIQDVLDEEDLQDHLEIHFQKPSNHGGEVESIRYISNACGAEAYFNEDTAKTEA
ncbi:hypothetical protein AAFF_G00007350 [Aldrovandia affinis]|uniref:UBX domain-containing protein 4 n=1 Tax=Aldrovandia affinis TaxID=143900 RepID=A0AAD7T608_9TELE|nr:hypothetical protein AAFF_G00007350 [Aldrovandia affinis]